MIEHQNDDVVTDGVIITLNTIIRNVRFMDKHPDTITREDLDELIWLVEEAKRYVKR